MKIALVHHTFSLTGGTERYGLDLACALADRGDEVHLFARHVTSEIDLPVHRMGPVMFWNGPGHLRFNRTVHRALGREIRRSLRPFDVVLGLGRTLGQHVTRLGGGCHAAYLEAMTGVPVGWLEKTGRLSRRDRRLLGWERRLAVLGAGGHIIAVSHRVKAEFLVHHHLPARSISVIHNGVDTDRFRPPLNRAERCHARRILGIPTNGIVVLFAGNGLARKGFRTTLAAFHSAARTVFRQGTSQPLRLLLVGKDPAGATRLLTAYRRALAQVGATLHAPGHLERMEIAYHAADLLVLPSRYEPFGNVCLEALASGLPAITTRVNGVAEILSGPLAELTVPSADAVDTVACRILRLLDPSTRRRLGELGRSLALQHGVRSHAATVRSVLQAQVEARRARKGGRGCVESPGQR